MYKFDFDFEDNMEEISGLTFEKTNKEIEKISENLNNKLFSSLSDDIEKFMYERFENVRQQYFDGVVAFLLGKENHHVSEKQKLEEWLKGVGYDQETFRRKIFQENRNTIITAITEDMIYERLENMSKSSYFKSWNFGDIGRGVPHTEIVRSFLNYLAESEGFQSEYEKVLDTHIKNKQEHLKELKDDISRITSEIQDLRDKL